MTTSGNMKSTALAALNQLDSGATLAEVIAKHDLEVEIEVLPGLVMIAKPSISEDGRAHLSGTVDYRGRPVEYAVSAEQEDVKALIREATEKNVPLRLAKWFHATFNRTPRISRVLSMPTMREGALGPRRRLLRSF